MGTNSATNNVGKAFVVAYCKQFPNDGVKVLDVSAGKLQTFTAARVQSKFKLFGGDPAATSGDEEWKYTQQLVDEFKAADKYVFLTPMWNFFIPYALKLYIDHIVQPALTFGMPDCNGLVTGKPAMVIRAAGGVPVGSEMDTGYAYMKAVLGFVGFTDVRLLAITGTANPDGLPALLEEKCKEAAKLAAKFDFDADAKLAPAETPSIPKPEPATVKEGAKVLFVTASPLGEFSATRTASTKFLEVLKEKAKVEVTTLDLADGIPDFGASRIQAKFATWGGGKDACPEAVKAEWDASIKFMDQLRSHDIYVFAFPMWNLTIPYSAKQWLDHVVQPHQTFDPVTNKGLLEGKRAFVVACSGNGLIGSPVDHHTPYMKQVLGLIGVVDVAFIKVKNKDAADEAVAEMTTLCSV
jgi:FMN-dependent NADH-azoreductase